MSDQPTGSDATPPAKACERAQGESPAPRRLPHPDECLPFRPAHKPLWAPRRKTSDPRQLTELESTRRLNPKLTSAPDLGQVRVNFRYASFSPSFASFSEKAGRQQYFESHHEAFGFRLHEVDPTVVDLQYQPLTLSWTDLAGRTLSMTFDYAIERDDGTVIVGEDKADSSYFREPRLASRFAFAEAYLETHNAFFERRAGGGTRQGRTTRGEEVVRPSSYCCHQGRSISRPACNLVMRWPSPARRDPGCYRQWPHSGRA